jgi:3-phenylpropionate/trans-cinnamate dioxygenase ferredoxin subunit
MAGRGRRVANLKLQVSNVRMAKEYVTVGRTSDIAPGTVHVFVVDRYNIAVANVGGEFYAFADVCTHDGGPVAEGELDDCVIECPRHGARFDITSGQVLSMPAVVPLPVYDLQVVDDEIRVSQEPK